MVTLREAAVSCLEVGALGVWRQREPDVDVGVLRDRVCSTSGLQRQRAISFPAQHTLEMDKYRARMGVTFAVAVSFICVVACPFEEEIVILV